MVRINCENSNPGRPVRLDRVKKTAGYTLKRQGIRDGEINIIIVSSQKIRALNRMYLGIDKATDVIAFWHDRRNWHVGDGAGFLGDIVISSDRASRNSRELKTSFGDEILLYVVHGVLHLLGYRDDTPGRRKHMKKTENEIFEKIRRKV